MQGRSYLAGLVTGVVVTGVVAVIGISVSAARAATQAAAPTMAKSATMTAPVIKVLLENAQVRVREVAYAPGAGDTHTHPWAHVGVILTKGQLAFQSPGGKEEIQSFEAGSAGFREAKVTHMVRNPGAAPMKVIEVEVK
jgi:quercetin dioxygenase-like cupin family protein